MRLEEWTESTKRGGRGNQQRAGLEEEQEVTEGIKHCPNLLISESLSIGGFELEVFSINFFFFSNKV